MSCSAVEAPGRLGNSHDDFPHLSEGPAFQDRDVMHIDGRVAHFLRSGCVPFDLVSPAGTASAALVNVGRAQVYDLRWATGDSGSGRSNRSRALVRFYGLRCTATGLLPRRQTASKSCNRFVIAL
jgi:hypothetical protein